MRVQRVGPVASVPIGMVAQDRQGSRTMAIGFRTRVASTRTFVALLNS